LGPSKPILAPVVLVLALAGAACGDRDPIAPADEPRRIVSMAPSLTETLVALELGDRVVGVTRFCPRPDGAVSVGGYFDPSYETILSLEPDLVVVMQSHDELVRRLGDLGIDTLRVDQHDVAGILESILLIASRCGVAGRGDVLVTRLQAELDEIAASVADRPRPRTLVIVGREPGVGRLGTLWAAGGDTFYSDVIELAGGVNAVGDSSIRYPELSVEGLYAIDPDVIVDVLADGGARDLTTETAAADWQSVRDLGAVVEGRVHPLLEDFVVIPGPRVVKTVRLFADHLHPEVRR
jgi:iron complex transport system substrate-binding protein